MSFIAESPQFVLTGLVGGFAIGLTGMGGGAVLTPVLLALGVPPSTAVGSDLVASLFIKPVAGSVHASAKTVRWDLVRWLCVGSIPAALAGSLLSARFAKSGEATLKRAIGLTLVVAATAMVFRAIVAARTARASVGLGRGAVGRGSVGRGSGGVADSGSTSLIIASPARPFITVVLGIVGGFLVGLTSVGSGSLMVVVMSLLYPRLAPKALVGTDIVQAVPLVAAAALGHVLLGNFRLGLTGALLIGGIPGAWVGARLSSGRATKVVRPALITLLVATGCKLVLA